MSPLASTTVIHPARAAHYRPVAEGAQTGTCTITTGGAGGWTPEAGPTTATPVTVYADTCRVQRLSDVTASESSVGQETGANRYLVAIKSDAPDIPEGARVAMVTAPDDARLVGLKLTVRSSTYGTLRFERDLICELDTMNQVV